MATGLRSPARRPHSLNDRIREAGCRLQNRRRLVRVRGVALGRTLHRRMAAPAMLLLAGGMGFLRGEFTRRQMPRRGARIVRLTPVNPCSSALNLIELVNPIGCALFSRRCLARVRSLLSSETSVQIPEPPFRSRERLSVKPDLAIRPDHRKIQGRNYAESRTEPSQSNALSVTGGKIFPRKREIKRKICCSSFFFTQRTGGRMRGISPIVPCFFDWLSVYAYWYGKMV